MVFLSEVGCFVLTICVLSSSLHLYIWCWALVLSPLRQPIRIQSGMAATAHLTLLTCLAVWREARNMPQRCPDLCANVLTSFASSVCSALPNVVIPRLSVDCCSKLCSSIPLLASLCTCVFSYRRARFVQLCSVVIVFC